MNILVTGGAGFIGSNLIPKLLALGHQVRVLDNLSIGPSPLSTSAAVELRVGDVRDRQAVDKAVNGIDAVVHLAAQTNVQRSIESPRDDFQANVEGTLNLLEASVKQSVRKFVFASSNAAVGQAAALPVHEGLCPKPLSPYGSSKLTGEAYCAAFYHSYGLETAALRFANAYGPRSTHKTSVVASFFREGAATGILTIYGDGRQTRDLVYVADLCDAIAACLERHELQGEVFQIGSGRETRILDLAEKVRDLLPNNPTIRFLPTRKAEILRNVSCIDRAKRILGFQPGIFLDEGLNRTYQWFVNRPTSVGQTHDVS